MQAMVKEVGVDLLQIIDILRELKPNAQDTS